jgi:hypothetical protein
MRRETTRLRERRSRWVEGDLKRELQDAKGIEKHKMQNGVKNFGHMEKHAINMFMILIKERT